jgi:hypothetical protein
LETDPELKQSQEYYDEKDKKDRIKYCFEKIVFSDGSVYEGEWMNGKKQGKGRMAFSNKDA